ncbi:hypothetical protein LTR62_007483 [Meristemomyces frigidus]|uniref:Heterokaryon incompatibility domain-containing protein n=1 Tax=Meristemomyces frigidus TaxID=1508187 RepID=A0AAN7TEI3_9PEZI|nr:hypothetical protein LTR62_007483 [Meristemomyces frigidus]
MRLLNAKTFDFQEFLGNVVPEYIILSHRWGASRAREWVWVDTVCIDKRSSAEVSQAVNSMYAWYAGARECFVFLSDVPSHGYDKPRILEFFRTSVWFTRGWTLQELLAPAFGTFVSRHWEVIGTRLALSDNIASITRVPQPLLADKHLLKDCSIAQKLSWAAKRTTTRPEDIAYCLLGLCGVNMPLFYGEGAMNAFRRLQLQILEKFDDDSLFAWSSPVLPRTHVLNHDKQTMLATSPAAFEHAGNMKRVRPSNKHYLHHPHYAMTNKGLSLTVKAQHVLYNSSGEAQSNFYIFYLNCFVSPDVLWPVVLCKLHREGMLFTRIYKNWEPQQIESRYPPGHREEVELLLAYVM